MSTQIIVSGVNDALHSTDTEFNALMGCPELTWNTTESFAEQIVPTAGTFSSLRVQVDFAPGSGDSYAFTVRKRSGVNPAADTALTTTISDSNTTNSNTVNSFTVAAGDRVCLKVVPTGGPLTPAASWSVIFTPDTTDECILMQCNGNSQNNGQDRFYVMQGVNGAGEATEVDAQQIIPCNGTLKNMYVEIDVAAGATSKSFSYTLFQATSPGAGSGTALTATVTDPATSANNTSDTVSVSAGDLVSWKRVRSTSSISSIRSMVSCVFVPSTSGQFPIMNATNASPSSSSTVHMQPCAGASSWNLTETARDQISNAFTAKAIFARVVSAPGTAASGKSLAFSLRDDAADSGLSTTITDAAVENSTSTDADISASSFLAIRCVPTLTPTVSNVSVSILGQTSGTLTRTLNETMTLSETFVRSTTTTKSESLTLSDTALKNLVRQLSEELNVDDTLVNLAQKVLTETLTATDTLTRLTSKVMTDAVTLSDTSEKSTTHILSDSLTLTDTFSSLKAVLLTLSETLSLTESFVRSVTKPLLETMSLTETFEKFTSRQFSETLTVADTVTKFLTRLHEDTLTVEDTITRLISKTPTETLTLSDVALKLTTRTLTDTVTLEDTVTLLKSVLVVLSETLSLTDTLVKSLTTVRNDTINLTDTAPKSTSREFSDQINLSDTRTMFVTKLLTDVTTLVDSYTRTATYGRVLSETLNLGETMTKSFERAFTDALSLTDTVTKQAIKNIADTLNLTDLIETVNTFEQTGTVEVFLVPTSVVSFIAENAHTGTVSITLTPSSVSDFLPLVSFVRIYALKSAEHIAQGLSVTEKVPQVLFISDSNATTQ